MTRSAKSAPVIELQTHSAAAELAFQSFAGQIHASTDNSGSPKRAAPEWVQISPKGELVDGELLVRGRDGRLFAIVDPQRVIDATELPMQFDRDHGSVAGSFFGPPPSTRAAGRIDRIEWQAEPTKDRPEPGFWGHVEYWTEDGRHDVEGGYYWGLSPAIYVEGREPLIEGDEPPPPALLRFVNVALTNRPNLRMQDMHSEGAPPATPQTTTDNPSKENQSMHPKLIAMAAKLGLVGEFSEGDLAEAVSLKFAADAEVIAEANDALRAAKAAAHAAEIEAVLDRHASKYAPSERASHREYIEHVPGGLEKFDAKFSKMSVLLPDAAPEKTEEAEAVVVDAELAKFAARHGWTVEQMKEISQ